MHQSRQLRLTSNVCYFNQVLRRKFDGHSFTDSVSKQAHVRRRYRITRLPRFLVLQLVRFTKNNFALEKNPTIVR